MFDPYLLSLEEDFEKKFPGELRTSREFAVYSADRLNEAQLQKGCSLQSIYYTGGVIKHLYGYRRAMVWFMYAASMGLVDAIFTLATIFEVTNKKKEAIELFRKAAEMGDEESARRLKRLLD